MSNPFQSPTATEQANASIPQRKPLWRIVPAVTTGVVLYGIRAILVFAYCMKWGADTIGGPHVDAGQMVWIPFFLADLPWSLIFDQYSFPSGIAALCVYALIVGLPWIGYGILLAKIVGWIYAKLTGR